MIIAIERDPRASRTRIIRDMHLNRSREKVRELFAGLPFHFVNGVWVAKQKAAA